WPAGPCSAPWPPGWAGLFPEGAEMSPSRWPAAQPAAKAVCVGVARWGRALLGAGVPALPPPWVAAPVRRLDRPARSFKPWFGQITVAPLEVPPCRFWAVPGCQDFSSPIALLEDGAPLPYPNSRDTTVRDEGHGRYCQGQLENTLYFSASDG